MKYVFLKYHTKYFFVALLLVIILGCSNSKKNKKKEYGILFKNITAIDAKNGQREHLNVLVSGNVIAEISSEEIQVSSNCTVINGKGKYIIPGLWDAHVHITFDQGLEKSMFPLFLANGITSIRDTGGLMNLVLPWKEKSIQEPNSSPNVFIAGPLLDGQPNVYDGSPGRPEISVGLNSIESAKAMVDSLQTLGVDFLKSYEMLTPEKFRAIINQGKKHGLFVTGHVPLSMDVVEASDAGLRSMEHLRNLEMSCSADFDSLLRVRKKMLEEGKNGLGGKLRSKIHSAQRLYAIKTFDDKRASIVLRRLAENETWQIPTLALLNGGNNRLYQDLKWRASFDYLPVDVRLKWLKNADIAQQKESSELSKIHGDWGLRMIPKLKEANVTILAGTDTPISFLTPGFSLHKELEMLVKGGFKPLEAIASATILPAKYFGLEKTMGTIEVGMLADLVVLDANPLENIKNTQKINGVVRNGAYYNREALNSLLQQSKSQ